MNQDRDAFLQSRCAPSEMDDGILQPMELQLDGLGLTASERESAHIRGKRGLNFSDEELCQLCKYVR